MKLLLSYGLYLNNFYIKSLILFFGTSAAYIFLSERLTMIQGLGMLVTIFAVFGTLSSYFFL